MSIIFTHKLKEVLSVSDRVAVMRNGRMVGTTYPPKRQKRAWPK
ncbi:MAG: hypothetical protein R3C44_07040 [Chloroflexota bacterium]